MKAHESMLCEALLWIARLPLLGDAELAALMRIDEVDARHLRFELDQRGWVEWITAGVPGLDRQRRFSLLRSGAAEPLSALLGVSADVLARQLCISRSDLLGCVLRHATFAGVNRLFADLGGHLVDARVLPVTPRRDDRWWPPGVDAYGMLRVDGDDRPFFVVWDRVATTDAQRRRRVQGWASGGRSRLPVVIIAAGHREADVWAEAVERSDAIVPVWITTAAAVLAHGALELQWRRAGRGTARLVKALAATPVPVPPLALLPQVVLPQLSLDAPLLREWAPQRAVQAEGGSLRERLAAIALSTTIEDRRVVDWLVRHPLLTVDQLGVLLDVPAISLTRRLEWLERCALVRAVRIPEGDRDALVPSRLAVRWLATEAGTTPRTLERQGGLTSALLDGDPAAHRRFEHDLGVNATFVRLHADARRAGGLLALWRNEAECRCIFVNRGRRWWVKPDGSGLLVVDGRQVPFLLEYDRGTLDGGDFAAKFAGFRAYYRSAAWRGQFASEPLLLFVCSDDRAERRAMRAALRVSGDLPVQFTASRRTDTADSGFLGPVWAGRAIGSPRCSLPIARSERNRHDD